MTMRCKIVINYQYYIVVTDVCKIIMLTTNKIKCLCSNFYTSGLGVIPSGIICNFLKVLDFPSTRSPPAFKTPWDLWLIIICRSEKDQVFAQKQSQWFQTCKYNRGVWTVWRTGNEWNISLGLYWAAAWWNSAVWSCGKTWNSCAPIKE